MKKTNALQRVKMDAALDKTGHWVTSARADLLSILRVASAAARWNRMGQTSAQGYASLRALEVAVDRMLRKRHECAEEER